MKPEEVLKKTITVTKEGSYSIVNGVTIIKTLDDVTILSCSDDTITFYTPFFNLNICNHVSQEKYGDYNIKDLTDCVLERILNLFQHRLEKSNEKYKKYMRGL